MALAQHKLNVIAAITLPVSAMAALLGMNLVHGMEGRSPVWFAIVAVVGLALGLGVKMWVGK
jgi:Mg2+ and Co2+ transporter CorA